MIFVLSQGTTKSHQIIYCSTQSGHAFYDARRTTLKDNEAEKFDLNVTQAVRFQEMLQSRSEIMGWINPMATPLTK